MQEQRGTITLIGSGELGESMARVHRAVLERITPPVQAAFVDTPAGFEVNADEISAKAVEYFQQHFDLPLAMATFRSRKRATALEVEAALHTLHRANYIFAGPGSPTYAIHNWRGSAVWDTMAARLMSGAHLVLASAGAIAVGCCSLPVYEIYKAGHEVQWVDGLDLLGSLGLKLAIVPHWNNTEGGNYDTRYCYMGQARLRELESQLSFDVVLLGIDEHTAITLDLDTREATVAGAGQVTVRYRGRDWVYPAGSTLSFDRLLSGNLRTSSRPGTNGDRTSGRAPTAASREPAPGAASPPAPEIQTATLYLDQIARAIEETGEPDAQRELIDHAHETMHELAQHWREPDSLTPGEDIAPFLDLLIALRKQLRTAKQYALADQVRQQLSDMGIVLEDTPTGTRWYRADSS